MAGYREGHDNRPRLTQYAAKNDERGHRRAKLNHRVGRIGIVIIHDTLLILGT
jgi:hypothetical protein